MEDMHSHMHTAPDLSGHSEPWDHLLAHAAPQDHIVHLYQDQDFLNRVVCRFAAAALANGEGVILVPTLAHWEAFRPRLEAEGIDIKGAQNSGQLNIVDADELLPRFMQQAMPDGPMFLGLAGEVIAKTRAAGRFSNVRWWGEMVNVLPDGRYGDPRRPEEGHGYPHRKRCAARRGPRRFRPLRGYGAAIHRVQRRAFRASVHAVQQNRPAADQCQGRGWRPDADTQEGARSYAKADYCQLTSDKPSAQQETPDKRL